MSDAFKSPGLTLLLLLATFRLEAQPLEPPAPISKFSQRYDGFKLLFGDRGLDLGTIEQFEAASDLSDWIVVELGPQEHDYAWLENVNQYLLRGASVLIASDQAVLADAVGLPARFQSGNVTVPAGAQAYEGRIECPIVTDVNARSSLFRGVSSLAFNRPGWLAPRPQGAAVVARFPAGTLVDGRSLPQPPAAMVVATTADWRLLLVADQSLFVNEMILELDNVLFARNVVDWLAAGKPRSRTKVLFLEGSTAATSWVDESFRTGDWSEPPPLDVLIAVANEMLAGLQEEDVFNRMLRAEQQQQITPRIAMQWRIFVPAALLLLFLGWRLHKAHARKSKPAKSLPGDGDVVPLEERRRMALASGNFADAGARLAEEFFHQSLLEKSWRFAVPRFRMEAGFWTRITMRRQMRWAWKLAVGRQHHLSRRGYRKLQGRLALWTLALQNRQMQWEKPHAGDSPAATTERAPVR